MRVCFWGISQRDFFERNQSLNRSAVGDVFLKMVFKFIVMAITVSLPNVSGVLFVSAFNYGETSNYIVRHSKICQYLPWSPLRSYDKRCHHSRVLFSSLPGDDQKKTPPLSIRNETQVLISSAMVGALSGIGVSAFRASVDFFRVWIRSAIISATERVVALTGCRVPENIALVAVPVAGGCLVSILKGMLSVGDDATGRQTSFPQELQWQVGEIEDGVPCRSWPMLAKSCAAVATISTGCSVGAQSPCVDIGVFVSR